MFDCRAFGRSETSTEPDLPLQCNQVASVLYKSPFLLLVSFYSYFSWTYTTHAFNQVETLAFLLLLFYLYFFFFFSFSYFQLAPIAMGPKSFICSSLMFRLLNITQNNDLTIEQKNRSLLQKPSNNFSTTDRWSSVFQLVMCQAHWQCHCASCLF